MRSSSSRRRPSACACSGQFADLDDPDRFVWIRGFDDMAAREKTLSEFYFGPVWQAHRDEANPMLVDNDNVLLMRNPGVGRSRRASTARAMPACCGEGHRRGSWSRTSAPSGRTRPIPRTASRVSSSTRSRRSSGVGRDGV